MTIFGGSISGGSDGIYIDGGALSIYGCCLQLSGSRLTGALQDGTVIDVPTFGIAASNLINTCSGALSIAMSTSPSPAVPTGSNLTYTVVVGYTGLVAAAQNITLTDALPAGTSFVSAAATAGTLTTPKGKNNTLCWSIPTLGNGQIATLTLVVSVRAEAGTTLTNTASVSSVCPDASNSATVPTSVLKR
jgi:uncharacterized repeat protein (TIGR01451 family)